MNDETSALLSPENLAASIFNMLSRYDREQRIVQCAMWRDLAAADRDDRLVGDDFTPYREALRIVVYKCERLLERYPMAPDTTSVVAQIAHGLKECTT